ncbi:MAG: hypothetical protein GC131_01155 [Alphaproteobacteria bacterium]|nr:hypothetical protein [Alphaproteobacteria bacterium]
MPYIIRDKDGNITKASVRMIPNADFLPHTDAKLKAFVESRGVKLADIEGSLEELRRTDLDMSRAVEDVITALLKKNILKMTDLPKAVQDRIALRVKMRALIAEAYDRASDSKAASR